MVELLQRFGSRRLQSAFSCLEFFRLVVYLFEHAVADSGSYGVVAERLEYFVIDKFVVLQLGVQNSQSVFFLVNQVAQNRRLDAVVAHIKRYGGLRVVAFHMDIFHVYLRHDTGHIQEILNVRVGQIAVAVISETSSPRVAGNKHFLIIRVAAEHHGVVPAVVLLYLILGRTWNKSGNGRERIEYLHRYGHGVALSDGGLQVLNVFFHVQRLAESPVDGVIDCFRRGLFRLLVAVWAEALEADAFRSQCHDVIV